MYCKKCGRQVDNDANFCPNCGCNLIESNINQEDPRSFNKDLFHTSNNINNINNVIKNNPLLKKPSKLDNALSIVNDITSFVSLIMLFFMLAFIGNFIDRDSRNIGLVFGLFIPIIIFSFINITINTYFLVKVLKNNIKIFRMLPLRIVALLLTLSSIITLIISLTKIYETNISPIFFVSIALALFAITISWSTASINRKSKMFFRK